MLELTKPLVLPIFRQEHPNDTIIVDSTLLEFKCDNKTYSVKAQVRIQFSQHARLLFLIPHQKNDPFFAIRFFANGGWTGSVRLPEREVEFDMYCAASDEKGVYLATRTSIVTASQRTEKLCSILFHILNFPEVHGPTDYCIAERREGRVVKSMLCGQVILRFDGWCVTIAATDETAAFKKLLRERGGFIITHAGTIKREDGSLFSSDQFSQIYACLHAFLSFAFGKWTGTILPVGFDGKDNRIFEQWGVPRITSGPWMPGGSWFDAFHSEVLSEVFPGFAHLWNHDRWGPDWKAVLHWYLGANNCASDIGVDAGLVLAQTAIEKVAWAYCIQDRNIVSEEAFSRRGLSAADRLRLLLSSLDIPRELPSSFKALAAKRGEKWKDAPSAITGVRNALVHAQGNSGLSDGSYYEAWKLSLYLLDLVMLRLCNHEGEHFNRVTQVWSKVPWAGKGAKSKIEET